MLSLVMLAVAAIACGPAKPSSGARLFGVISDPGRSTETVRDSGVNAIVVRLSWRETEPAEGRVDTRYLTTKRKELTRLEDEGFYVIADLGLQDAPSWVHRYPDSYYVDQRGARYRGDGALDNADANLIWNPKLRALAAGYVDRITSTLGRRMDALRIGGSHWNELGYPPGDGTPTYWAYDGAAAATRPTGEWRPGQPSPNGEARRFYDWYAAQLVDFQEWQVKTVRRHFSGRLMLLLPGWGLRPGDVDKAVAGNLSGRTGAERTGEVSRGHDWARQVAAITDRKVLPTTTWLDAALGDDAAADAVRWNPIHYVAQLARTHRPRLQTFGENTGQGDAAALKRSVAAVKRYGMRGMVWYRLSQLYDRRYARLKDYAKAISRAG